MARRAARASIAQQPLDLAELGVDRAVAPRPRGSARRSGSGRGSPSRRSARRGPTAAPPAGPRGVPAPSAGRCSSDLLRLGAAARLLLVLGRRLARAAWSRRAASWPSSGTARARASSASRAASCRRWPTSSCRTARRRRPPAASPPPADTLMTFALGKRVLRLRKLLLRTFFRVEHPGVDHVAAAVEAGEVVRVERAHVSRALRLRVALGGR